MKVALHLQGTLLYVNAASIQKCYRFFFIERVWLIDKKCTVTSHINDDYTYKSMCSFNNLF